MTQPQIGPSFSSVSTVRFSFGARLAGDQVFQVKKAIRNIKIRKYSVIDLDVPVLVLGGSGTEACTGMPS